jgi:hypothetical protein
MPGTLADLVQAQNSGYDTGKQQAQPNALGLFIRTMLATQQKNRDLTQEYGLKKQNLEEEAKLKQKYPSPLEALISQQLGGGMPNAPATTEQAAIEQIPKTDTPEDYNIKVETRSVRGIPQSIYRPEKKNVVSAAQQKELYTIRQTRMLLERNLEQLQSNPEFMKFIGPGLVTRPGAFADIAAQFGGAPKNFVTFKADVDKAFQKYRKEVTGVQAGYAELQWLAPDLPKTTDTSANFIAKTNSSIEQLKKSEEELINLWSNSGLASGKLRENINSSYTKPQKQNVQLDEETALSILEEVGGDRNEAEKIARERGYQF